MVAAASTEPKDTERFGAPERSRVILRLRKMQALRKAAKQGKLKQPLAVFASNFSFLVTRVGFEPTTPALGRRRSIH
jgi:hypothetical protein